MTSYQEIIDQFRADITNAGMVFKEAIIADGVLHRVYVEGDKTGTKNGAYVLHANGKPSGYAEHFPSGFKIIWSLSVQREPLSLSMRRQIEDHRKRRNLERKYRQKETAKKAQFIWQRAELFNESSQHPYLIRKQIKPYLARLYKGALLIPLFNESRELVNLQFIDADGNKRILAGGKKQGCFSVIGDSAKAERERLLICEGYATGASLHKELGVFVMVAMDAGNLEPVAQAARRLFPEADIIIAGDNDASGKGQAEASKAALAVNGKYLIPDQAGADWNDVLSAGVA